MTPKTFLAALAATLVVATFALACDSSGTSATPAADPVDAQEAQLRLRAIGDTARVEFLPGGGLAPGPATYPSAIDLPPASQCYAYSFEAQSEGQTFVARANPKASCAQHPAFEIRGAIAEGKPTVTDVEQI